MLNPKEIERNATAWLAKASEEDLRSFVAMLDSMVDSPHRPEMLRAFNKECNRRASADFETRGGGEWI